MKGFARCRLLAVVALCMIAGCRVFDSPAPSISLPESIEFDAIEVLRHYGDDRSELRIVDVDPKLMARFREFVNSRSQGWKQPFGTFPASPYTIRLMNDNELMVVFWLSPEHIGGRFGGQDADDNRLRSISEGEWQELASILGIRHGPAGEGIRNEEQKRVNTK